MTSEVSVADQSSTQNGTTQATNVGAAMDAVNLERALIDFEIANARVIDLTARLTDFHRDLLATRSELGLAKLKISELEVQAAELAVIKTSSAYRAARKFGNTRASIRADVAKLIRR